jgi:hypothetical protein
MTNNDFVVDPLDTMLNNIDGIPKKQLNFGKTALIGTPTSPKPKSEEKPRPDEINITSLATKSCVTTEVMRNFIALSPEEKNSKKFLARGIEVAAIPHMTNCSGCYRLHEALIREQKLLDPNLVMGRW